MPLLRDRQPMASTISMGINIAVGRRRDCERGTSGESDVKKEKKKEKRRYKGREDERSCTYTSAKADAECRRVRVFPQRIRFQERGRIINEIVKVVISVKSWLIARHIVFIIRSRTRV